jgi:hypothetical protein
MLIDWRVAAAAAVFCTGILFTCIETNAQAIPKEVAARVEMHTIPSLTLSDQQFLTGDANGAQRVTMAGEFRIAQGLGKLPAVVLMHGSGGISPSMDAWMRQLNSMGISTFVIDGFSGRSLTSSIRTRPNSAGSISFSTSTARSKSSPSIRASTLIASS